MSYFVVHRRTWLALASAAVLLLPGCSEEAIGPGPAQAPTAVRYSFTRAPRLPRLHSSKVKYRDAGKKYGITRFGFARISVRALAGPSVGGHAGATVVEVTTGTFEAGGNAPGSLKKVQIRQLDARGRVLSHVVFNKPSNTGYAQFVLDNVVAGSMLQVQAHVSGLGPGTQVVTVLEEVKQRPDLVASELQAPARTIPHAPTNISALVSEQNGDVGARADCVLLVDGVAVDRAAAIWVDAGSAVNCAFTHEFATAGTSEVRVVVEDVEPGDWNSDNNSVARYLEVGTLEDFYYEASAKEFEAEYRVERVSHIQRFTLGTNALQWTQDETDVDHIVWTEHQFASHFAIMPFELQFPLASLEMEHSTDGAPVAAMHAAALEAQWGDRYDSPDFGFRYACAADYEDGVGVTHLYMEACARRDYVVVGGTRYEFPATIVSHWRWAGEVTFLSSKFYERRFGDGTTEPSVWISNTRQQAGPAPTIPLGATYTMSFRVRGSEPGALTYASTAVVPLDQVHVPWWVQFGLSTVPRWEREPPCFDFRVDGDDYYDLWHSCEKLLDYEAGRFGFVSTLPPVEP